MRLTHKSSWNKLSAKLNKLRQLPQSGQQWAEQSAKEFEKDLNDRLVKQGRGGSPPPLTAITMRLYRLRGKPDGSGIRNHINRETIKSGNRTRAIVGISAGKPSMIARVQDRGATIRITAKSRRWFRAHGIFLKPSTVVLRVPGRKFWTNSWRKAKRQARRSLKKLLSQ